MRRGVFVVLIAASALFALQADPKADALAILQPAVQAHGGKDALAKAATYLRLADGKLHNGDAKSPFSDAVIARLPDRLRVVIDLERGVKVTHVLDGKTGWKAGSAGAIDLAADSVAELREEAYVLWIATLAPLLGDGFTLRPAGDAERDGKKVVGVVVGRAGHADATLWFDKASKLLVAIDKEATQGGEKIRKRYVFGDHKDFAGAKLPTRLVESVNDKVVTEVAVKEYRLVDRIDDASFRKP